MTRWSPIERTLREQHGPLLVGVDEVGRGPLAGPVVACAVVMPPDRRAIAGVDDSKQLDARERERLVRHICRHALVVSVGAASAREIDRINIYHATVLAMRRALARVEPRLGAVPHHVIVDGNRLRTLGVPHTAVVKGDAKCYAIACASIVAKVTRDRLMAALARRYDGYGWERNAGYGTPFHLAALAERGLTPHHRRRFCIQEQMTLSLLGDGPPSPVHDVEDTSAPADLTPDPSHSTPP
ncbi:MAG TPA: ribonuclease HII [Gemmatimonas sp.]|nr:ribonuclease HII [Gemmatimonas sp.]